MSTLLVNVDDALMERIADVAQGRGEATEQVVVEALRRAFQVPLSSEEPPLDAKMLEILAPFWAEQDRQEADGATPIPVGQPGDAAEAYMAQHWAEDIRKRNINRE